MFKMRISSSKNTRKAAFQATEKQEFILSEHLNKKVKTVIKTFCMHKEFYLIALIREKV